MRRSLISLLLIVGGCAAPTRFTGSPHVEGGPAECTATCQKWGMELAGMVTSGEFADGCICQVHGKQVTLREAAAAELASMTGVMRQVQIEQEQQAQQQAQ